jgi:hypothetical protein
MQERFAVFHEFSGDGRLRMAKAVEVKDRMMKADKDGRDTDEERSNSDQSDG